MLNFRKAGLYISPEGSRGVVVKGRGKSASILNTWQSVEPLDFNDPEKLSLGIRKAISGSGIKAGSLSVSIPDSIVRTAVLDFDELPESGKDLTRIVTARAVREFETDLGQSVISFQSLPSASRKKVLCVAADRKLIGAFEEGVEKPVSTIRTHSLNIVNLLSVEGEIAVLLREHDHIAVLVFKSGVLDFYRCKDASCDDEVRRELAASITFYCGRNPEYRLARVLLLGVTGKIDSLNSTPASARLEAPGPDSFNLSGFQGNEVGLLAAAGSCV